MPATTSPSSQNNITFQHNTDANPGYSTCLDSNLNSQAVLENIVVPSSEYKATNKFHPRIAAIIHSSDNNKLTTMSASNCVLDPLYPAMEPVPL